MAALAYLVIVRAGESRTFDTLQQTVRGVEILWDRRRIEDQRQDSAAILLECRHRQRRRQLLRWTPTGFAMARRLP